MTVIVAVRMKGDEWKKANRRPRSGPGWVESGEHHWLLFAVVEVQDTGRHLRFAFQPAASYTPLVRGDLDDNGEHLVISRLEVLAPSDSRAGVTGQVLRSVPIAQFLAVARAYIEAAQPAEWSADAETVAKLRDRLKRIKAQELPPRGRRGFPDSHYRRIALAYLDLYQQGVGKGLIQRLAEIEERPAATVRDWVHGARLRGFLTKGEPGRAGAAPGPRLFEETG